MAEATTLSKPVQDALQAMAQAFDALSGEGFSLLGTFAQSEKERATRLTAAEAMLVKELGENDPQVLEIRGAKEHSNQVANGIELAIRRAQLLSQPRAGELALYGQVLTADSRPAQGMIVLLAGLSKRKPKRIGESRTNEFGDFALLIPVCELERPGGKASNWQLVVEDSGGDIVSSQTVPLDPSQSAMISFISVKLEPVASR